MSVATAKRRYNAGKAVERRPSAKDLVDEADSSEARRLARAAESTEDRFAREVNDLETMLENEMWNVTRALIELERIRLRANGALTSMRREEEEERVRERAARNAERDFVAESGDGEEEEEEEKEEEDVVAETEDIGSAPEVEAAAEEDGLAARSEDSS
jgi:hypothetical protein